jgi:hypothetical protein
MDVLGPEQGPGNEDDYAICEDKKLVSVHVNMQTETKNTKTKKLIILFLQILN